MNPLDLRAWLATVEKLGELRHVRGAHWNLELGAISEMNVKKELPPALLFDEIKVSGTARRKGSTCEIAQKPRPGTMRSP